MFRGTLLLICLLSFDLAFADDTGNVNFPIHSGSVEKRLSGLETVVFVPLLALKKDTGWSTYDYSFTGLGFAAGYRHFPINRLGWSAGASYMQLARSGGDLRDLITADANAGIMFSPGVYLRGGLNFSYFLRAPTNPYVTRLTPGLGGQVGAGWQFGEQIFAEIQYMYYRQSGLDGATSVTVSEAGPKFSFGAMF